MSIGAGPFLKNADFQLRAFGAASPLVFFSLNRSPRCSRQPVTVTAGGPPDCEPGMGAQIARSSAALSAALDAPGRALPVRWDVGDWRAATATRAAVLSSAMASANVIARRWGFLDCWGMPLTRQAGCPAGSRVDAGKPGPVRSCEERVS